MRVGRLFDQSLGLRRCRRNVAQLGIEIALVGDLDAAKFRLVDAHARFQPVQRPMTELLFRERRVGDQDQHAVELAQDAEPIEV